MSGEDAARPWLERIVTAAWHEALGVPPASVDDDFFALGGHSLLAGEVAARLEQVLDVEIPLTMVFDHPTVAAQAAWIGTLVRTADGDGDGDADVKGGVHVHVAVAVKVHAHAHAFVNVVVVVDVYVDGDGNVDVDATFVVRVSVSVSV
nr:phosphopantetheine-binding protein [Kofleriaceae bacterium]